MYSLVGERGVGPKEAKISKDAKSLAYLTAAHRLRLLNSRQVCWLSRLCGVQDSAGRANNSLRAQAEWPLETLRFRSEGGRTRNDLQCWKTQRFSIKSSRN